MEFLPTGLGKSLIFQMLRTLILSNIGIKTFAIGTGDEEAIDEGATTGSDRMVGESFGFCCPGVEQEFFAESTNALFFSLTSPMNIIGGGTAASKECPQAPSLPSHPLSELDFCLRPIPHLGACSQATFV